MATAPKAEDLEYRPDVPDPEEMPYGSMRVEDVHNYQNAILELGRKKNDKTDLFGEVYRGYDAVDYYLFSRLFVGSRFADPNWVCGVGNAMVNEGIARALFDGDVEQVEDLRSDHSGSLSRALKEEVEPRGDDRMTLSELHTKMVELARTSGDEAQVEIIEGVASRMEYPSVWTQMIGNDISFYVYRENILKGASENDATLEFDRLKEAADIYGDGPLAVWDHLNPDRTLTTTVEPHTLIGPMKAQSDYDASNIDELNQDEWVAQTKYDGARLFIQHTGDGDPRAYLIGGDDITAALPELFEDPLHAELPDCSFILDCEVTPYDSETGEVLSFQNILKRAGREGTVELGAAGVEARFKFFDVLYYDGNDLRDYPYEERLSGVEEMFRPPFVARTGENLEAAFERSLDRGHEGVVLKRKDHHYEMNTRSDSWQKWKAEPMEIECEVTGVAEGSGRAAESVGSLELGLHYTPDTSYDAETVSVGHVGTGFSDEERDRLWEMHKRDELVGKTVQVSFEELQMDEGGDSWALRFPSFDGMRPEGEVDSLEHVACDLADMAETFEEWAERHETTDEGLGELFG